MNYLYSVQNGSVINKRFYIAKCQKAYLHQSDNDNSTYFIHVKVSLLFMIKKSLAKRCRPKMIFNTVDN